MAGVRPKTIPLTDPDGTLRQLVVGVIRELADKVEYTPELLTEKDFKTIAGDLRAFAAAIETKEQEP